jgi:hypothetical protein
MDVMIEAFIGVSSLGFCYIYLALVARAFPASQM